MIAFFPILNVIKVSNRKFKLVFQTNPSNLVFTRHASSRAGSEGNASFEFNENGTPANDGSAPFDRDKIYKTGQSWLSK